MSKTTKTRIAIAALSTILSTGTTFAEEISTAECASIREAVVLLLEANRDASAAKADVNMALIRLLDHAYGQPEIVKGIEDANDKLRIAPFDNRKIVEGLAVFRKVCPS